MNRNYVIYTVFLIGFAVFSMGNREQCAAKNGNICKSENKYSEEANTIYTKYLDLISKAKSSHHPCEESTCKCYSPVISKDLKPFKSGITQEMLKAVKSKGTKYQIINGKLYREKDCMFPARCAGVEHFLKNLSHKLPNVEFVLNTRDWPQIHKDMHPHGPVLSFSKTVYYNDIMYPAWSFWEGGPAISLHPKGIGRWDLHRMELAKVANDTPWNSKIDKAFFRGSRTSSERDALVMLSRQQPDLVDARYTKNQAWKSDEDTLYQSPAPEVSFTDHCKYKYLFNFRGVAASFRFKHVLLCKSVVFHVGDEWLEFFYPSLKPWIHYVPVNFEASKEDIHELIMFAKDHQEVAQEIANNGFGFIWNHLQMKHVSCYWLKLLKRYAKLLTYEVTLDDDMYEIK